MLIKSIPVTKLGLVGLAALSLSLSGCSTRAVQDFLPSYTPPPTVAVSLADVSQVPGENDWAYFSRLQTTLVTLDTDKRGRGIKYTDPSLGLLASQALDTNLAVSLIAQTTPAEVTSTQRLLDAYQIFLPVYQRYSQVEAWYPREFTQELLDAIYIQALLSRALSDDVFLHSRLRMRPYNRSGQKLSHIEIPAGLADQLALTSPTKLAGVLKNKLDKAYFLEPYRTNALKVHQQLMLLAK